MMLLKNNIINIYLIIKRTYRDRFPLNFMFICIVKKKLNISYHSLIVQYIQEGLSNFNVYSQQYKCTGKMDLWISKEHINTAASIFPLLPNKHFQDLFQSPNMKFLVNL